MDIENMDVNILVSIINLKLRDYYENLEELCDDMDISKKMLIEKLKKGNYEYMKESNSFK